VSSEIVGEPMPVAKKSSSNGPDLDATTHQPPGLNRLDAFNTHRKLLFAIAYRMLGSVADAEDMLQDTYVRWQQALDGEIRSPRAFLVTIVSRLCLNHLDSARVRREEYFGEWLPEPLLTEGNNDPSALAEVEVDDSLSFAFLVLLERLTPMERAVFLLREVFEYEYEEIADILGQSAVNCRQLLRRSRQHVAENRPRFDPAPQQRERLMKEFLQATAGGNLERLMELLTNDVILHSDGGGKGPALPVLIQGARKVARALIGASRKFVPANILTRLASINGELATISYHNGEPFSVITLEVADVLICGVYIVSNPEKLAHLPAPPSPA
jgi:RNA polymerase sigma-70 factor (ECF subfamily)